MLGTLLRRDRERQGLTLAQAAGRIGVSAAKLRRIEDGDPINECDVWDRLATFYGWPRSRS
jgi:transcriptional regulator with XRE-family HTH domain